ncbi:MAG: TetR/AcrR family transcriptional regulator [Candidatus Hodarchaeales archaeon]|jgi:AcrR family transcriptional regulator
MRTGKKPAKTSRQESKDKMSEKILLTTKKLSERDGYSKVTTTGIANEATISVGIIYRYFPKGKAAIVKEFFRIETMNLIEEKLLTNLDEITLDNFINILIGDYVTKHRENESLLTAVATAYLTNKEVFEDVPLLGDTEFEQVSTLLNKFDGQGSDSLMMTEESVGKLLNILDCIVHYHIIFANVFDNDQALITFLTEFVLLSSSFKTLR